MFLRINALAKESMVLYHKIILCGCYRGLEDQSLHGQLRDAASLTPFQSFNSYLRTVYHKHMRGFKAFENLVRLF